VEKGRRGSPKKIENSVFHDGKGLFRSCLLRCSPVAFDLRGVMMVEDELRDCIQRAHPGRTLPTDHMVSVPCSVLERAIKEIELMRLTAGAVTNGESFAEIARQAEIDYGIALGCVITQ
jgi:hypothetical protein